MEIEFLSRAEKEAILTTLCLVNKHLTDKAKKELLGKPLTNLEFIEAMGISKRTAQSWRDNGIIEYYKIGRQRVYLEFASQMKKNFYNFNQTYFETILTCVELIKRNRPILGSDFDEYHRILLTQLSIYEKWELFTYVDAFDHPLRSHLRGNNFFRDLTDINFEDPEIFHAFKQL